MKSIIFLAFSCFLLNINQVSSQSFDFENSLEVPMLIDMKPTPLNRCACNNKAVVPVKLPKDAKGWYYSVTFAPRSKSLSHKPELLREVVEVSSQVSIEEIDDHIQPLQTNRNGNIYIIRGKEYADSFNQCKFFYHHGKYIGTKSKSGYVENSEGETFYIGIERPSEMQGLQVKVEVVAVI